MSILNLWNKDYKLFNEWRRNNDLPNLIASFAKLPDFKIWQSTFGISTQHLLQVNNIGAFFCDDENKIIYQYTHTPGTAPIQEKYGIVYPKNLTKFKKELKRDKKVFWEFTPYLRWALVRKSWNKLIDQDPENCLERFTYTLGTAPNSPSLCQWNFVTGFRVLKLGGVTLHNNVDINFKNLDFVNLDHLTVTGDYHGNTERHIYYSHIDNLSIENATWRSVYFFNCHIFNLRIIDSKISNFVFVDCLISGMYGENSNLQSFHFEGGSLNGITMINTSLDNITYKYPTKNWYEGKLSTMQGVVNTLDELKLAFQANGHREEAKEMFLRSKNEEMKLKFSQSVNFYGFGSDLQSFSISRMWYRIKTNVKSLSGGILSLLPFLLWDFGRKPILLFLHWFLMILFFTIIYNQVLWSDTYGNLSESFFTSVNCIFRLGIDINEFKTDKMKFAIGLESMISLFLIPLIVAGFVNKSKY